MRYCLTGLFFCFNVFIFSQDVFLEKGVHLWRNHCYEIASNNFEKLRSLENLKDWQIIAGLESAVFAGKKHLISKFSEMRVTFGTREKIRWNIMQAYISWFNKENSWKYLYQAETEIRNFRNPLIGERLLLAQFYALSGKVQSAEIIIEYIQTLYPQEKRTLRISGILHELKQEYSQALHCYKNYLLSEIDGWVLSRIVKIHFLQQNFSEASRVIKILIDLEGESPERLFELALSEEKNRNFEYSEMIYNRVSKNFSSHSLADKSQYRIALMRMNEKKDALSVSILTRLLRKNPDNQEYKKAYKIACEKFHLTAPDLEKKKFGNEIVLFHQKINEKPQNPENYLELYRLYMKQKNFIEANEVLKRLIKIFPNQKEYRLLQLKISVYLKKNPSK